MSFLSKSPFKGYENKDRGIVLKAVKEDGWALYYADKSLKKDREIVWEAVKQFGMAFACADDKFKKDRKLVLEAVKRGECATALKYADTLLKKDEKFILQALKTNIEILKYADDSLTKDKKFILKVVKQNGWTLEFVDTLFRKDEDVILAAVKSTNCAFYYIDDRFKKDRKFMLKAVKTNGHALEFADTLLRKDREIVLEAVKQRGSALEYADDSIKEEILKLLELWELKKQFREAVRSNDYEQAKICLDQELPINTKIGTENLFEFAVSQKRYKIAALVYYTDKQRKKSYIDIKTTTVDSNVIWFNIRPEYEKIITSEGSIAEISVPRLLLSITYILSKDANMKKQVKTKFGEFYKNLYKRSDSGAILNIISIAAHGVHRLAQSYPPSLWDRQFKVFANPNDTTTGTVYLSKTIGAALGCFVHGTNHVYLGIKTTLSNPDTEQASTLIHEITHFVAKEIYGNDCKPYKKKGSAKTIKVLNEICEALKNNPTIDPTFRGMFSGGYTTEKYHSELIARTTEYLWKADPDHKEAAKKLKNFNAKLHDFYFNVFIKDCNKHYNKLLGDHAEYKTKQQEQEHAKFQEFKLFYEIEHFKTEINKLKDTANKTDITNKQVAPDNMSEINKLQVILEMKELERQDVIKRDIGIQREIRQIKSKKQQLSQQLFFEQSSTVKQKNNKQGNKLESGRTKFMIRQNDPSGYTNIHNAVIEGNIDKLKELKKTGVSFKKLTMGEYSALRIAIRENQIKVVNWLLDQEGALLQPQKNQETPLQLALRLKHFEIAALLINKKVDLKYHSFIGIDVDVTFRSQKPKITTNWLKSQEAILDIEDLIKIVKKELKRYEGKKDNSSVMHLLYNRMSQYKDQFDSETMLNLYYKMQEKVDKDVAIKRLTFGREQFFAQKTNNNNQGFYSNQSNGNEKENRFKFV